MSEIVTMVVKADENGNIIDSVAGSNIGLSVTNPVEYDLIFNKVPIQQYFEIRKYKVVMEGFKPTLVLKDGETPPVIPEPELTLEQKVEKLQDELKEQKEINEEFQAATYGTLDFLFSKQN